MQDWEKLLINDAFDKSPVLKTLLISSHEKNRVELLGLGIEILAIRSGMREDFIKQNIEEIINL